MEIESKKEIQYFKKILRLNDIPDKTSDLKPESIELLHKVDKFETFEKLLEILKNDPRNDKTKIWLDLEKLSDIEIETIFEVVHYSLKDDLEKSDFDAFQRGEYIENFHYFSFWEGLIIDKYSKEEYWVGSDKYPDDRIEISYDEFMKFSKKW